MPASSKPSAERSDVRWAWPSEESDWEDGKVGEGEGWVKYLRRR